MILPVLFVTFIDFPAMLMINITEVPTQGKNLSKKKKAAFRKATFLFFIKKYPSLIVDLVTAVPFPLCVLFHQKLDPRALLLGLFPLLPRPDCNAQCTA